MKNPKVTKCNSVEELHDGEMQFLQEQITFLAKDIMELDENQDELYENMNRLADVLDKASEVAKNTVECLWIHQKEIKALNESLEETDKVWWWILAILIWNVVLTLWIGYYVFF